MARILRPVNVADRCHWNPKHPTSKSLTFVPPHRRSSIFELPQWFDRREERLRKPSIAPQSDEICAMSLPYASPSHPMDTLSPNLLHPAGGVCPDGSAIADD